MKMVRAVSAGVFLLAASALAQTGSDRCEDAPRITTGINYAWTSSGVGADGSCSCFDPTARTFPDLWYKYVPDRDGYLVASACGGRNVEAALAIFQGCDGAEIACNDDRCGFLPEVGAMVVAGRTYLIRLATARGNPRSGTLALRIEDRCLVRKPYGALVEPEECGARTNDGCFGEDPNAVVEASLGQTYYGSYFGLADCTRDYDTYRFTITQRQRVTITARGGIETLLQLFRGACDGGRPLSSNFSGVCGVARISFVLPPGTYRAVVCVYAPCNNNECGTSFQNQNYVVTLGDPEPLCKPDFNGDGFVDFFDLDGFTSCFVSPNDCPDYTDGDFDGDGFTDFNDYDEYVRAFEAGC
jgi:hypothetical protein